MLCPAETQPLKATRLNGAIIRQEVAYVISSLIAYSTFCSLWLGNSKAGTINWAFHVHRYIQAYHRHAKLTVNTFVYCCCTLRLLKNHHVFWVSQDDTSENSRLGKVVILHQWVHMLTYWVCTGENLKLFLLYFYLMLQVRATPLDFQHSSGVRQLEWYGSEVIETAWWQVLSAMQNSATTF